MLSTGLHFASESTRPLVLEIFRRRLMVRRRLMDCQTASSRMTSTLVRAASFPPALSEPVRFGIVTFVMIDSAADRRKVISGEWKVCRSNVQHGVLWCQSL
jgi:hypothetical protein